MCPDVMLLQEYASTDDHDLISPSVSRSEIMPGHKKDLTICPITYDKALAPSLRTVHNPDGRAPS
ncbi:uncharacterized protein N7473_006797 [Penicillium subrubescens]|uniref:uncharacterized protein n=1 Tax=Penicillium subrubescens TaxID=1316194 RepID=UPI002544DECE|nr:uncharacterized protein N7473_006797 [Penicillium subrubescens]KAJ5890569.1 hypothetical protein N7473_006797 [Penicillium subrubescens]